MTEGEGPATHLSPEAEQFLLHEFEAQREMRGNLNSLVAAESNIFVAIVAATFVGLSFLGQAVIRDTGIADRHVLYLAALGVLMVDYLLGWSTFRRVVSSRITVVRYARSMNRARRYFVDQYPGLGQFTSPDIYDNRPPMGAVGSSRPLLDVLSGNTGLVAILASACAGALAGVSVATIGDASNITWLQADQGWKATVVTGTVVLVAFAGSMAAFERHASQRFRAEESTWNAHFPIPQPSDKRDERS